MAAISPVCAQKLTSANTFGFTCFNISRGAGELRHACAAPDEGDLHYGLPAAVDSIRKTLGG
jgi:hypothetical protein